MLLVIDSGNTRTKWALVDGAMMQAVQVCMNADLATSSIKQAAKKASKVMIANVAGHDIAQQLAPLIAPLNAHFVIANNQACNVINQYKQAEKLGADRWAALIGAWHINQQPTLVVNAGTAITIDCLAVREINTEDKKGVFLGGTIMPGLRLMQAALNYNTAQLNVENGEHQAFPINTQNAIKTGCLNAAAGALAVQLQQLQKHSDFPPKIIISGGDAFTIASALKPHLKGGEKQLMIVENLVLQGLTILEKEYI